MAEIVDGARPLRRLERAIKHRKMIVLNMRRPFDRASSVDVADDGVGLVVRVSQLKQRRRHRLIDDLNHPSANELLVLNQREVRLNTRSIALHHEADGSRWR